MSDKGVALVTGAGGSMGQATVQRLAEDGFDIAAMDINEAGLKEAVERVGDRRIESRVVDQTVEADVRAAVAELTDTLGPIEALVNTTGWCEGTFFSQESSDYWDKVININYKAALYVTQPVLLGMIERKRGKIVYITSDAAKVGTGGEAVYAGAKAAECAFAKSIARENARYNINVNCIAPGPTESPLMREVEAQNPEMISRMVRLVPFRRLASPEEQASVVSFLVSEDAQWITGQVISTSGGLTMQ
ncbi:MAG: hypothetical protein CMO26_21480 [Thiotrichales bacterium]|nr:hypothetical protein [Thiotrichales bacterium]